MKKTTRFTLWLIAIGLGGCAGSMDLNSVRGVVVVYQAVPGSTTKEGIDAWSDTGRRLFGPAELKAPSRLGDGGGTSSYGGMGVPKWVEVSWRTGEFVQRYDRSTHSAWTGGNIIARHRVDVASRLPPEVLKYVSEKPGRAIRLIFRIKDDGVLLGWDVQEMVYFPKGGSAWVWSLHGGDFPCDPMTPYETRPTCTSGYLKDASWYSPLWR